MSRRDKILLAIGIVLALILAFPMRPLIWQLLVVPVAQIWWQVRLLYRSFPQQIYYALLIVVFLYIAAGSFSKGKPRGLFSSSKRKQVRGQVENLAEYITLSQRGVYFRWSIARSLGILATKILELRGIKPEQAKRLEGKDWSPPARVQAYLKAGLFESFANYSPRDRNTPFNIELEEVVSYLESQLETSRDNNQ